MPQKKSKKILLYFFLFLIVGTLNNKNLAKINFLDIKKITTTGLDEKKNQEIEKRLNFLKSTNIFFLNEIKIIDILEADSIIEDYSIFKTYPSAIKIEIIKTNFLANVFKDGNNFLLGSNGKLTKINDLQKNIPLIVGKFSTNDFFELKKIIDKTNLDFDQIEKLLYFESGRWDIEMYSGLLIKLPREKIKIALELSNRLIQENKIKLKTIIDLRQNNQVFLRE